MTSAPDQDPYTPIPCSVHDKLEETAVRKTVAHFVVRREDGSLAEIQDRLEDLFTRNGAEYMRTAEGHEIRLDRLESVNGERVSLDKPES